MKNITINKGTKGSGTIIVFLPGLFAGGWMWDKTLEDGSISQYPNVIFSNPLLDYTDGHDNVTRITEKIANELLNTGLDGDLCLVGNSLGSLVAVLLANDGRLNVQKIVLSGCPGMNKNINLGVGAMVTPDFKYGRLLADKLFYNKEAITDELVGRSLDIITNRQNYFKLIKIIKELDEYSITDQLKSLQASTLLVWGEYDVVTPLHYWTDVPALNKKIGLKVVNECGHSPMLERPDIFNKILYNFITGG